MEIICSGCNSKFVVPDEKIPKGKIIKIKCPKCGEKIVLETKPEEKISIEPEFPEIESYSYSDDEIPDIYEETRLALFIGDDPELLSRISQPIEDMEYKVLSASDTKEAIGKLRLHQFDLILLQEGFGGDIKNNIIMKYLNRLSMAIRRKTFVILLSKSFKTMDQMMAFALSVNLIINLNDLDKLSDILDNAIKRNERFYKPFLDIMKEIGKL